MWRRKSLIPSKTEGDNPVLNLEDKLRIVRALHVLREQAKRQYHERLRAIDLIYDLPRRAVSRPAPSSPKGKQSHTGTKTTTPIVPHDDAWCECMKKNSSGWKDEGKTL